MKLLNWIKLQKCLCSAGRPFHTRTTRSVKKYLRASMRLWCGYNLYRWPRVLMFAFTEFASVKNSFPALVTRPNTIYKCISSLDGVALFRDYLRRGVVVSFYNQYLCDIVAVWWNFSEQIQFVWFAPSDMGTKRTKHIPIWGEHKPWMLSSRLGRRATQNIWELSLSE